MRKLWELLVLGFIALFLAGCFFETSGLRAVIRTNPNPARGPWPLTVTFDGRASQGEIEEWVWTFFRLAGGEEAMEGAISGDVVEYTFEERGQYRVYLEVRAKDGRFHQAYVDVDVRSKPPVARFTADPYPQVQQGTQVNFDASPSSDPDGTIVSYIWDFGDGFWDEPQGSRAAHCYNEPGTYTVKLVVEDDCGDRSEPASLVIWVVPKGCGSCP